MLTPLRGGAARQPDPHPAGLDRIGWEGASDRVARQRSGQAGQGCVGGRSERAAATVAFWQITTDGVKKCVSICSISICRRDRKSTRRTPVTNAHPVCRLLLEQNKLSHIDHTYSH